jgi:hypothetical protein
MKMNKLILALSAIGFSVFTISTYAADPTPSPQPTAAPQPTSTPTPVPTVEPTPVPTVEPVTDNTSDTSGDNVASEDTTTPEHPSQAGLDAAVAAELTGGSSDPKFDNAERVGLCLAESVVGLIASHTDHVGCGARTFTLGIETTDVDGPGVAVIDGGADAGGTTLGGSLSGQSIKGVRCNADLGSGNNQLKGVGVPGYVGRHVWGRKDAIFNSNANIKLLDPSTKSVLNYGEEDIKDYYKRTINQQLWQFDWGLEKVLKNKYPRAKWSQVSWYRRENGVPGVLKMRKYQVAPRSANGCTIELQTTGFNGSGEFQYSGTVQVSRVKK